MLKLDNNILDFSAASYRLHFPLSTHLCLYRIWDLNGEKQKNVYPLNKARFNFKFEQLVVKKFK